MGSHPKSETEGASGPTKWTLVQQNIKNNKFQFTLVAFEHHSYIVKIKYMRSAVLVFL